MIFSCNSFYGFYRTKLLKRAFYESCVEILRHNFQALCDCFSFALIAWSLIAKAMNANTFFQTLHIFVVCFWNITFFFPFFLISQISILDRISTLHTMATAPDQSILEALRGYVVESTKQPTPRIVKIYISSTKQGEKHVKKGAKTLFETSSWVLKIFCRFKNVKLNKVSSSDKWRFYF